MKTESTPLRLLTIDSRVDDTQSYEDDKPKVLCNEDLYGREKLHTKQRYVSNLEDVMGKKPIEVFRFQANEIQKELKSLNSGLKTERSEDRLTTTRVPYTGKEREIQDLKAVISRLEGELTGKDEEIAGLQKQVQARTTAIRTLEKELSGNVPESESRVVLGQICEALGVKTHHQVVPAYRRLENSVRNLTRLEKLMAEISAVVCPDRLETSGETVLLGIKRWEAELTSLRSSKLDEGEALQHIRQILCFKEGEDIKEAANRLFLQLHELTTFSVHLKQCLGVSESCSLSAVMLFVKQVMRRLTELGRN